MTWGKKIIEGMLVAVLELIVDRDDPQGTKTKLLPDGESGLIDNGTSLVKDVAVEPGTHATLTAMATVTGADGKTAVTYTRGLRVRRGSPGNAVIDVEQPTLVKNAAGWTFTAAVNGGAIRFTLSNASGEARKGQILIGWSSAIL